MTAKNFASNSLKTTLRNKNQDIPPKGKSIKSQHSFNKVPTPSFNINGKTIKSNIMKITKKTGPTATKQVKTTTQSSPNNSWTGKYTVVMEHVGKSFKSKSKVEKLENNKSKKSTKPATPIIKGKVGGIFKIKGSPKSPKHNNKAINGMWCKHVEQNGTNMDDEPFVGRSVKDYVRMFEEKHSSSCVENSIIQGYARPFKEFTFTESNMSQDSCLKLECVSKEKGNKTAVCIR